MALFSEAKINKQIQKLKHQKQHRIELKFNYPTVKIINAMAKEAKRSRKNYLEHIISMHCMTNQLKKN